MLWQGSSLWACRRLMLHTKPAQACTVAHPHRASRDHDTRHWIPQPSPAPSTTHPSTWHIHNTKVFSKEPILCQPHTVKRVGRQV